MRVSDDMICAPSMPSSRTRSTPRVTIAPTKYASANASASPGMPSHAYSGNASAMFTTFSMQLIQNGVNVSWRA